MQAHEQPGARLTVPFAPQAGTDGVIEGYASVFRAPDDGRDIILPGAFRRTLENRRPQDVKLLWQHDPREPVGVVEALREDDRGLFVRARLLPALKRAREALALIAAGALDGLSIGFRARKSRTDPETGMRLIADVELWEISLVTFPMQPAARIRALKSHAPHRALRDFEAFLREAGGFSRSEAKAIAGHGLAGLDGRKRVREFREKAAWKATRRALTALITSMKETTR